LRYTGKTPLFEDEKNIVKYIKEGEIIIPDYIPIESSDLINNLL